MSQPPFRRQALCARNPQINVTPSSPQVLSEELPPYRLRASFAEDSSPVENTAGRRTLRRQSQHGSQSSFDSYTSMPHTNHHDDGSDFSPPPRDGGILASIIDLYTAARRGETAEPTTPSDNRTAWSTSVAPSRDGSLDVLPQDNMFRKRTMSAMSVATDGDGGIMDDEDPRVTGAGKNTIDDEKARLDWDEKPLSETGRREQELKRAIKSQVARQAFILKLAKALMLYGAPSHRLESQLAATARVLAVPCQIIHFPGIVLLSFHDKVARTSETHIVKATTRLMLGKLHTVHMIYRAVVHSEIGVKEGTDRLVKLIKSPPIYTTPIRCAIAFCCAFIICLSSFGGSFLDAFIAGLAGFLLAYLQLHAVKRSAMFANIFEISTAIWVAFIARGLSSWQGDYFCYSAISSAGVVLILPGFAVLSSALELASKSLMSGSARLVWAVSYTLFLGFSLTAGSDLWFLIDSGARDRRRLAASSLTNTMYIDGSFVPDFNETAMYDQLRESFGGIALDGAWTFVNQTASVSKKYHYQIVGCYRDPSWQWWRQPLPIWSLFILVPLYSLFNSFWNLQPFKSKQLPVMVTISCFSYAARKTLQHFIGPRNEVVSAVGALVIGVLGNVYARIFKGTAFTCMVTAVCFLVPSGLAAAGGLAMNYQGTDDDQYTSTIAIGVRMLTVAIGTTVGLLTSSLVVYAFGPKKKSALFAF